MIARRRPAGAWQSADGSAAAAEGRRSWKYRFRGFGSRYLATSDSWLSSLGPESGHTERESPRFAGSAGIATVLFHPDFNRRLRSCTESADPSSLNVALVSHALGRRRSRAWTSVQENRDPLPPVGNFAPP